ncbi:hypothetical protein [Agrobacterium tumefaciens]|uniref:hypothetical protein n=1 Tax=Agrobacterium tumefaciens TaxID=358 RepID=UPI00278B8435|nr:hypothetical protein [Agrobacterium tumefaciens]MDP9855284.1 hypothetical protein [Agrobacterium tumefaciens]
MIWHLAVRRWRRPSTGRFDEADFGFAVEDDMQSRIMAAACSRAFRISSSLRHPRSIDRATVWMSRRLSRPGPDGIPIVSRMSRIVVTARSSIRRFCQPSRRSSLLASRMSSAMKLLVKVMV